MKSYRVAHATLALICLTLLLAVPVAAQSSAPTFGQTFTPDTIGPGSTARLSFDITNVTGSPVTNLAFTNNLPAGFALAAAPAAASTCTNADLSAPPGATTVTLNSASVAGGTSCSVSVNVVTAVSGTNTTGSLTSSAGNSGTSSATLTVDAQRPGFSKSFSVGNATFEEIVTLTFTIDNTANTAQAVNLGFVDVLPFGMTVASPANVQNSCGGGIVTATPGSGAISYARNFALPDDASVPAGASCAISVDVRAGAVGTLDNVTGELTSSATFGGTLRSSGSASDRLVVGAERLQFSKRFLTNPARPGETVDLEFTITNLDRGSEATGINFTDDLDATLVDLVATSLPSEPCGAGSSISGTASLSLSGGTLGAEASCTFSVAVMVPADAAGGSYLNTTSSISATANDAPITGDPATDVLTVETGVFLTKEFTTDPVGSGGSVTLEFTLTNSADFPASEISFFDDFPVELPTASVFPISNPCGAGSTVSYSPLVPQTSSSSTPARLTLEEGALGVGGTCTFSIDLDVAPNAATGFYTNTTSSVSASIDGVTSIFQPATDDLLVISAPRLDKQFTNDPATPGGTVTLQFELLNEEDSGAAATDITFTDDLGAALAGLVAVGLPASNVCGAGSELSGTSTLTLTGGNLATGETCVFSVDVTVPGTAAPGNYTNTTSNLVANVGGVVTIGNPGTDDLTVAGLTLTKEFLSDPVLPGSTVDLRFTIQNNNLNSPAEDATGIFFQDDLDQFIDNATAVVPLPTDPCGAGSSLTATSGGSLVTLQSGALAAGATCTFDVTVQIPAGTESTTYTNATQNFRAIVDGATLNFDNASDELTIDADVLQLTKEFTNDPVSPGSTVNLQFTLQNLSGSTVSDLAFIDDLGAALGGLVAVGLPASECGGTLTGTSVLSFSGGSLGAGASCSFGVTVQVPSTVAIGTIVLNTTSSLSGTLGGVTVFGAPASDQLEINSLTFSKSFAGSVPAGGTVSLTFNITNPSATLSVDRLSFSDDLGAMLAGATASNPQPTPPCGAGSTLNVGSLVQLVDGSLLPGGSCSFSVDVAVPGGATPGDYTNTTSELLSDGLPAGPAATALLTVVEANEPPVVAPPVVLPLPSDEGQEVTATASFSDPDSTSWTCMVDYGAGDGPAPGSVSGNTCVGTGFVYPDNGTYTVTISVTDDANETGSNSSTHDVLNVAPTITNLTSDADDCGAVAEGDLVSVDVDFSDPGFGPTETFSATVDWGDGSIQSDVPSSLVPGSAGTPTTGTFTLSHAYLDGGLYEIELTVEDDDGGATTSTFSVLISGTGISDRQLGIIGTPNADDIDLTYQSVADTITVTANFLAAAETFDVADFDLIAVVACAGDDEVTGSGNLSVPSFFFGGFGSDTLNAPDSAAALFGGPDDDLLQAGSAGTTLRGDDGNDDLRGGQGDDDMDGGAGDDELRGAQGDDLMQGGAGNDMLYGEQNRDTMSGGPGDDVLDGGQQDDTMNGDEGSDILFGSQGSDVMRGGEGPDHLEGNQGGDDLFGDEGDDHLFGNQGPDDLDGGDGFDECDEGQGPGTEVNCEQ